MNPAAFVRISHRLPIVIAPRWGSVDAQPIAIKDLLSCLIATLDLPFDGNRIFEIGGSDRVSYGGLMKEYARQRGSKRLVISVPFGVVPQAETNS